MIKVAVAPSYSLSYYRKQLRIMKENNIHKLYVRKSSFPGLYTLVSIPEEGKEYFSSIDNLDDLNEIKFSELVSNLDKMEK